MKKLLFVCIIFLFAITNCDRLREEEIIARNLMYRVSNILASRYQLRYLGYSEEGDKTGYTKIGLCFNRYGKLSRDEGRRIIVDSLDIFLNEINSDYKLQPFLINKTFTINNVEITIVISTSEGKEIFYPDVSVFSAHGGKIYYSTYTQDQKFVYTRESETFEEALRIVEAQNQENQSAL